MKNDDSITQQVLHLRQVEKLSGRQITKLLRIDGRRVYRIINGASSAKSIPKKCIIDDYHHLIVQWYKQYPKLQAKQVFERLKEYGFQGSYGTVLRDTLEFRQTKPVAYHPLVFLPGEEAQVDWFFVNHPTLGQVAGFLYVLAYSRYAWGMFYPKHSFEFFLAGHVACFKHIGGLAHQHRYDNLKSVVIKRTPEIQYNGQFLDFARFYGFSIHACNPNSGQEKGRVERIIRDIRPFIYAQTFSNLNDLNHQFHIWLEKRNNTVHRSTNKTPKDLLSKERLKGLPEHSYPTSRILTAVASKTALVEFETNKYSVPSSCATKLLEIAAYPSYIEIYLSDHKVAIHNRSFERNKIIQNPLHAEKLLNRSPHFKMQRILQLIRHMDNAFNDFIEHQENDDERINSAYQLFSLLRTHSRAMLISAVRELNTIKCFKIKAINSLLNLPESLDPKTLWPQNPKLLNLKYQGRNLNDYDPNTKDMGAT